MAGAQHTTLNLGPAKWMGCMGREFELFIPWCRIVKIGPDIILVDIDEKEAKQR